MLSSEELRVTALAASAKRGKWVARRRIFWRWISWISWRYVLPVIGLLAVITTLVGLVFWQYLGHEAAYIAAQKWVQQEFGNFQTQVNHTMDSQPNNANVPSVPSVSLVTNETTLHLQLERQLVLKVSH